MKFRLFFLWFSGWIWKHEVRVKVSFVQFYDSGDKFFENMWAVKLGKDIYRLDNCPFYAYGISVEDEFFAPFDEVEGRRIFRHVTKKSGNSTVRLQFDTPIHKGDASDAILEQMKELGCSYEGADRKRIAVNIPASVRLSTVSNFLIKTAVVWEHADPEHDKVYPDG